MSHFYLTVAAQSVLKSKSVYEIYPACCYYHYYNDDDDDDDDNDEDEVRILSLSFSPHKL